MPEFRLPPQIPNRVELLHRLGDFDVQKANDFTCRGADDKDFWYDEFTKLLDAQPEETRKDLLLSLDIESGLTELFRGKAGVQVGLGMIHGLMVLRNQAKFDHLGPEALIASSAMSGDLHASVPEHIAVLKAQLKQGCPEYFEAIKHFFDHLDEKVDRDCVWAGAVEAYRIVNQQIAIENDRSA